MATRQYIGARYTPKFSGTYDNTQAYEALEVVDNGSGTTYIARQPVPPNTPLTNTTYWLVYGSSSGAILDLQGRVGTIEDEISVMNGSIMHIGGEVDAINTSIASVGGLNSLNNRITNNSNDIDSLEESVKRNIIEIGNSYVHQGVCEVLNKHFEHNYQYYASGIGFTTFTDHTVTFEDKLDEAIADTSIDKSTITDILFVSAVGDTASCTESLSTWYTNMTNSMSSIRTKIKNNYPNCKWVKVVFAESRDVASYGIMTNYQALFFVHHFLKRACYKYEMDYIGWAGFNALFEAGMMESDHMHLSATGNRLVGTWIESAYFGKAEYIIKRPSSDEEVTFKYTNGSTITVRASFTPENVFVNCRRISLAGGSVTLTSGQTVINSNDFAMPVPAPNSVILGYSAINNITDNSKIDYMQFLFDKNTNGTLKVATNTAPEKSSISTVTGYMPNLMCLNYAIVN